MQTCSHVQGKAHQVKLMPLAYDPRVLTVLWKSHGSHGRWSQETNLMWHWITSKGEVVSILHGFWITLLEFSPQFCIHMLVTERQDVFPPFQLHVSTKWHPSKLMGCKHHHKYTVTHPTARSPSQWDVVTSTRNTIFHIIKGFQELEENQKMSAIFQDLKKSHLGNIYQIVHLTSSRYYWHCISGTYHSLSSSEIICIKPCHSLPTDLLCDRFISQASFKSGFLFISATNTAGHLIVLYITTHRDTHTHTPTQTTLSVCSMAVLQEDRPWRTCVFDWMF